MLLCVKELTAAEEQDMFHQLPQWPVQMEVLTHSAYGHK